MATDPLTLRRQVAEVLPRAPVGWGGVEWLDGAESRYRAALWEHVDGEWLPVLSDDGTRGVLLGELERLGVLRSITRERPGWRVSVWLPRARLADIEADTLGEVLARALVEVADG